MEEQACQFKMISLNAQVSLEDVKVLESSKCPKDECPSRALTYALQKIILEDNSCLTVDQSLAPLSLFFKIYFFTFTQRCFVFRFLMMEYFSVKLFKPLMFLFKKKEC